MAAPSPAAATTTTIMSAPMPSSNDEYDPRATIIIIGMKGAGKTTIGLMANRTMGRTFIDTDHRFRTSQNSSVESYVAAHGWHAFRAKETSILKDLLVKHPFDAVIACGGGIIESSESRRLLKSVMHTMPVIRVLREESAIRKYIDGRWLRQYDEDLEAMMRRRALLYRECCSHTFYNLTCDVETNKEFTMQGSSNLTFSDPLKFKQMGNSFERLLRSILGSSFKIANHSNTFADPELGANNIEEEGAPLHSEKQIFSNPDLITTTTPPSGYTTPPVLRSSISNLLAPHGPGPMPEIGGGSPTLNENKTTTQKAIKSMKPQMPRKGTNGTYTNTMMMGKIEIPAILPCRANALDRSSLLTRRTTAMSYTFADLTNVDAGMIKNITQGVDAVELRADMLDCLRPATATARSLNLEAEPMIDYEEVARQLETLRKMTPEIPILFTLRSDREGGFFHDDRKLSQRDTRSPHSQAIYFKLLSLAIGTGVEMLDVELGWDPWMTKRLIESRGRTKIVLSYHDLMGALKWDSGVARQLYDRACSFGEGVHIVMMIGTTTRFNIEQNQHLGSFSARILSAAGADPTKRMPPLMALNMGLAGRSSRPFNDVLNFVSHPAMPMKAGKGQLSLKEMMETLVRLSMIRTSHFHLYGDVYQSAKLVRKAIKAAFEEFGLPFTLLDEGTWSLTEYIDAHHREDFGEREEEEKTMINSMSDGLFIADHAHRQIELYEIMLKRCPNRITKIGKIVQAIDIMARQDVALALLGTERGRHVPNSLGDIRGPLIGCHTLPDAIERTLSSHLAPINAPNMHRTGLIIVLNDDENENEDKDNDMDSSNSSKQVNACTMISKRSALYALGKLGLGTIFIVEQNDPNPHHQNFDEPPFSRRQSATPAASRESSVQPTSMTRSWTEEVLQLIQDDSNERIESSISKDEIGIQHKKRKLNSTNHSRSHHRIIIKNISLSSLAQSSIKSGHDTPDNVIHFNHDDEDAETMAALQDFEKNPSKRPCAIVVVGGSEEKQKGCLSSLPSNFKDINRKEEDSKRTKSQSKDAFILPEELWRSSFGGTIVRIPSQRSEIIGSRSKIEPDIQKVNGNPEFSDDQTATLHNGWILVEPWMIERNRVQRNVIEAWTRRSAPSNHLRSIWD